MAWLRFRPIAKHRAVHGIPTCPLICPRGQHRTILRVALVRDRILAGESVTLSGSAVFKAGQTVNAGCRAALAWASFDSFTFGLLVRSSEFTELKDGNAVCRHSFRVRGIARADRVEETDRFVSGPQTPSNIFVIRPRGSEVISSTPPASSSPPLSAPGRQDRPPL